MKVILSIGLRLGVLFWVLFLGGCLPLEDVPPPCGDVQGMVEEIHRGGENEGNILIVGDAIYDRAVLRVTPSTSFFRRNFEQWERIDFSTLRIGDTIEACFGGPIMESYPIQVLVRQVVIFDAP
ncbi:MAG: hypothetical protein ABDK94_09415 [Atribacterota bacterium]